MVTLYC